MHAGLTLKNETINIEPLEGALFGNLFRAETDRNVATFKNQSNYLTSKGNKINCNATSDDSISNLKLNMAGNIEFSNAILPTIGADFYRPSGSSSYNLRIRDVQAMWEFRNRTLTCRNGSNENLEALMEMQSFGAGQVRLGTASTARVGVGANPNINYFLNVGGTSNFHNVRTVGDLDVIGNINLTTDLNLTGNLNFDGTTADINNVGGLTFYKATTDSSNVMTVGNDSGKLRFRGIGIDSYNANDTTQQLFLNMNDGNAVRCNKMGIGVKAVTDALDVAGGNANFGSTSRFNGASTFNNDILIWNNSKIYRRVDANDGLNFISTNEINFSLQPNRETDPTTGTIALQLNVTNGITINRAVTNNLTFKSIGNITGEADVVSYGKFKLQNAGEIREVLDTQYKMYVRNGDGAGEMNIMVGAEVSTPEIKITDAKVNLLGHLEITHGTVSTSEKVKYNNPDTDGAHLFSLNNTNKFTIEETTCDVYNNLYVDGDVEYTGSLIPSSDERLKKNI